MLLKVHTSMHQTAMLINCLASGEVGVCDGEQVSCPCLASEAASLCCVCKACPAVRALPRSASTFANAGAALVWVSSQIHDKAGQSMRMKRQNGTGPCCMAICVSAAADRLLQVWWKWRSGGPCLHGGEGGTVGVQLWGRPVGCLRHMWPPMWPGLRLPKPHVPPGILSTGCTRMR
jgi:hypothetical protein